MDRDLVGGAGGARSIGIGPALILSGPVSGGDPEDSKRVGGTGAGQLAVRSAQGVGPGREPGDGCGDTHMRAEALIPEKTVFQKKEKTKKSAGCGR